MGRCGHHTFYVFDDLHVYRSKEQLPQRKHPHPEVRQVYLFTRIMHILMLCYSYLVLLSGFYFAPPTAVDVDVGHLASGLREYPALSFLQTIRWYIPTLW